MFSRQGGECTCVLVFMYVKGVQSGAWLGQDTKRAISPYPEGPNPAVQTQGTHQGPRAGKQRAPKHPDQNTKCKSGGWYGGLCPSVSSEAKRPRHVRVDMLSGPLVEMCFSIYR